MFAQPRIRSPLYSWVSIPKRPATWQWTAWLVLSLSFLTFGSSALAGCGGSGGGCSSGGCSSEAGSPSGPDSMANDAGSSMRGGSMQNPYSFSSMQYPQGSSDSPPLPPQTGPHGGILSTLQKHQAEVVFAPKETRVYLYAATGEPVAVRGVRGEVAMKIRGISKIYRYALQESSDAQDQSYLLLRVDATRLRDGDMVATFELNGLPSRDESRARFVQTFALTQPAAFAPSAGELRKVSEVRQVATTPEDRPLIARQKICPVTGEPLDSMGGPIKLMVDGKPLFVCCEGCVDQVKSNPTMILAKLDR